MVDGRYLLVSHIPVIQNGQGQRSVDELWQRDLIAHLNYISQLVLAAPCERAGLREESLVPLEGDLRWSRLEHVDLPAAHSTMGALVRLPITVWRLWWHIGHAQVVHAHVVGWPIPTAWIAAPIAWWHRRFLFIVVEASPWLAAGMGNASLKQRIRGAVFERLARFIVNRADLAIFTHEGYRRRLLTRHPEQGHVINASWIDAESILSDEAAHGAWVQKMGDAQRVLRLLFAGRLLREKGVEVLMDAMRLVATDHTPIELHVMGAGELLDTCQAAAAEFGAITKVRVLPMVPYDQRFLEQVRGYDALVVPSISEEQPRIVYDAFSQAVPVLASNTDGLRAVVTDGQTGRIFETGDAEELAKVMKWALEHRQVLMEMGLRGLSVARSLTHSAMHARRHAILEEALSGWPRNKAGQRQTAVDSSVSDGR